MQETSLKNWLVTALIALVFGFGGAALWSFSGLGNDMTRHYLLENPDILPEMVENLERAEASKRLASAGDELTQPFPGAVLGNPEGAITLVKFTDYGCGYCRTSRPDVDALIADNPDLRVVIREWPIFQGSDGPARMALAAAQQGKFAAFHDAMFEQGSTAHDAVLSAAAQAGLDLAKADAFLSSDAANIELAKNTSMARQLGFGGTPSWVVGDAAFEGAVGKDNLQKAVDDARDS